MDDVELMRKLLTELAHGRYSHALWEQAAVNHYPDGALESLRREFVRWVLELQGPPPFRAINWAEHAVTVQAYLARLNALPVLGATS